MAAAASALRLVGAAETVPDVNVPETADVDTESRQRNSFMSKWTNPDARVHRCGSWPSLPSGRTHRSRSQGGELRLSSSQRSVSLRTWVARRMPRSSVAADIRGVVRRFARRWHQAATSHLTSHSSVSVSELYCCRTGLFAPAIKPKTLPAVVSKRASQRSRTLTLSGSSPHKRFFTYSPRVEPAATGTDSDPAVRTNRACAFRRRRSSSVLVGNSKPSVFVTSAVTRR